MRRAFDAPPALVFDAHTVPALLRRWYGPPGWEMVVCDIDLRPGSPGAALLPELGPEPEDLVLQRFHGLGPMGGTDLGAVLRNLGVQTVIGTGVSVNVAITNFAMDAVNAGFDFVLPRDAVAGVPQDYADAVIDNTLSLVATITRTDDVVAAWTST